ncbi:hypothetical protein LSAT2_008796, partial [Lamellibrachia satsuma]
MAQVCSGASVELIYPSHSLGMFYTNQWRTLLERIGNKRLMYLLENRAFFVVVAPSNYLQVTGIPIYELWPLQDKMATVAHPDGKVVHQRRVDRARRVTERQKRKRRTVVREITSDVTNHD